MIEESAIRARLIRFLNDEIALDEFDSWLTTESWNMHRDSDPDAQDLASAVLLAIAEYEAEDRSYAHLRRDLQLLAGRVVASIEIRDNEIVHRPGISTGTISPFQRIPESPLLDEAVRFTEGVWLSSSIFEQRLIPA